MFFQDKYTFKNIVLKTKRLSELHRFYVENLGFRAVISKKEKLVIQCGSSRLTFEEWPESCVYHFALNIPENQTEEAVHWLRGKVEILRFENQEIVDFPNWNAHSIYFADPAGNIVELIARHNLNNATNFDFGADSVCEISEIGIAEDDIKDFYEQQKQKTGFEIYWGNTDNFAAIGHEQALFITVPTNRPWMPTDDIMSRKQPLKVILHNGKDRIGMKYARGSYSFS